VDVAVRYEAPPTLSDFLDSEDFVRVVVGPIGSGKSTACCLEILSRAMRQAPGPDGIRRTRFAVVRNTYRELNDTTRKTFEQWIPDALGAWNEQDFSFTMEFRDVRCEVLFRALDRPEDVKKLLSLELTGCYFNEIREIAKAVFDGMTGRVGRYPSKNQGGPTWWGVWGDTNPWHTGHWGYKLFKHPPKGYRLFKQPGGRSGDAENTENLVPGYYDTLCAGKDAEWINVYVNAEYGTSDFGAIFGNWIEALELKGAISAFPHEVTGIHTNWDLGIGDTNSIWFWRLVNNLPQYIDHYASHGKGLQHYFDVLAQKTAEHGYQYAKHWLPHDARQRSLQTGISTVEQFVTRFGVRHVGMTPELSIEDGLRGSRYMLEQPIQFHTRCEDHRGLEALREYRYEWDEANQCFSKKPLHNWASNSSDAFRYSTLVVQYAGLVAPVEPKPEKPTYRTWDSITMNELLADAKIARGGRKRI
jgi:hypothetical protein